MKLTFNKIILSAAVAASLLPSLNANAQKLDTVSSLSVTGYIDAYYAYYTDSLGPGDYQKFPTSSPRSNTPGLNIAQISVQYAGQNIRATGVFHYGDIANATWATPFNNIQEAHAGVKLCSKLWVDAGFFRTHFGTELLTPAENITSSVTVGTYHEPYYQSGIRLNFDPTPKLEINVYLLNGYNLFVDNNNKKSAGLAVTYAVNEHLGIGYTDYIGDDAVPNTKDGHLRFHNNAYLNYQKSKFRMQIGGDFCVQQNADAATGTKSATMFSALATFRYQCCKKWGIYARGEVFSDPDGYMSTTFIDGAGKKTGYKLTGYTAGMEYKPTPESYIKLEGRLLEMDKDQYIFKSNGYVQKERFEVLLNAGVTFDLLKKLTTRVVEEPSTEDSAN